MSRIRSLHPGLFTDDAYMALSFAARELVKGLWCEADDNGVFAWKPLTIKAKIFPADNLQIVELLDELVRGRFILAYETGGRKFGAIRNFLRFQRPRRPSAAHPLPDNAADYLGGIPTIPADASPSSGMPVVKNQSLVTMTEPLPSMSGIAPQMEDGGDNRDRDSVSSNELTAAPPPALSDLSVAGTSVVAAGGEAANDTGQRHGVPDDPKRELYALGKRVLGRSAGGMVTNLLRCCDGDVETALYTLRRAQDAGDPREYLGAVLRRERQPDTDWDAFYRRMGLAPEEYGAAVH